ncbi:MAG: alpha/beta hydrolase [Micrococcaceae bacterium]
MTLHPAIAELVATLPPTSTEPPDPEAKRAGDHAHLPPAEAKTAVRAVEDFSVSGAQGSVAVRLYDGTADGSATPVIVYAHGGAFFSGDLETHDHVCRDLAAATGWRVLAVDYRLAPEARFPAGLEDLRAVIHWVGEHPEGLGWDGARLVVAGDSSGANFAAVLAADALDGRNPGAPSITDQVLFYPSLDLDFNAEKYPSIRENAVGYGLETAGLAPFNSFYLGSGANPDDVQVSPIKREEFAGLPRALVITAQYDPLRDEGEQYAQRLLDAGVEVSLLRWDGANHGFIQNFSWIPEMHAAYQATADFLNRS